MNRMHKRPGLILLVVLGMLTLFSLLAVTFVVFASQSRSTNVAFSRRYARETTPRPLFEEAVKQLIRGTTDANSSMWGHDLLGDLYGVNETQMLRQATVALPPLGDFPIGDLLIRDTGPSSPERPILLGGGRFLRIPLQPLTINFPAGFANTTRTIDDVLTGRIVTFYAGQGPLGGQSFRIVRYVGDGLSDSALAASSSSGSITIDLFEADLNRSHTQIVAGTTETHSLLEWAGKTPVGAHLCYANAANLTGGFRLFINAVPLNGHGLGTAVDGTSQMHVLNSESGNTLMLSPLNELAVGLISNSNRLGRASPLQSFNRLFDPDGTPTPPIDNIPTNPQIIRGDSDEPIDAADYNSMFLAYRTSTATNSTDVIPSFHRAALVNYLVNLKPLSDYTDEMEFWALLHRIEQVVMRPLSINVISASAPPPFMDWTKIQQLSNNSYQYRSHAQFDPTFGGIPTLNLVIPSSWDPALIAFDSSGPPLRNFQSWIGALTNGPWDVDNTGDGIPDSIWMDLGLPLQRTPDGKLLKALVAFHIEDLDGKIDINAAGGRAQAGMYAGAPAGAFDLGNLDNTVTSRHFNQPLAQGLGYGPADISFRQLVANDAIYQSLIGARYASNLVSGGVGDTFPGRIGLGAVSKLQHLREYPHAVVSPTNITPLAHRHARLPGMPIGMRGRVSLALDHLGNPLIHNYSDAVSIVNNEYESRLVSGSHYDAPFQLAEWERLYRFADADQTTLPDRLQRLLQYQPSNLISSPLRHQITVHSRHLRVPKLAAKARVNDPAAQPGGPPSYFHWVNSLRRLKSLNGGPATDLDAATYRRLFPLEFLRAEPMNVNRLFGNGLDENGNGEIDEPIELVSTPQPAYRATDADNIAASGVMIAPLPVEPQAKFDFQEPPVGYRGVDRRQLFARHLYCLAQLIVPIDYQFPNLDADYWQQVLRDIRSGPTAAPGTGNAQAIAQYIDIRGRILAQWAVNVVDFRDSDAVMTRFPYDPDPLDILNRNKPKGWYPQRNSIGDVSDLNNPQGPVNVVWGMEQPELLLTESLAFHDLRIRQAATVNPTRYDQFRIPQGSLFLELYCPRTTVSGPTGGDSSGVPGVPRSLYELTADGPQLNLGKLSPPDAQNNRFPVWRIYLSQPANKTATNPPIKTPNERLLAEPPDNRNSVSRFDLTYQLAKSNLVPPQGNNWNDPEPWLDTEWQRIQRFAGLELDRDLKPPATRVVPANQRLQEPDPERARVILFTRSGFTPTVNNTPGVADPRAQVFFNRESSDIFLHGNQYLVIGPRATSYLGSRTESKVNPPLNRPNHHRLQLTGNWASMYREDGSPNGTAYRTVGQNVRPAVTMIAAAQVPPASVWAAPVPPHLNSLGIGVNVSEPLPNAAAAPNGYYDKPTEYINEDGDYDDMDGYYDHRTAGPPPALAPFDRGDQGSSRAPLWFWNKNRDAAGATLREQDIGQDANARHTIVPGTAIDWCTAYLQRLADPDKPWNAIHNPYLTVDWIPVDLTVFNGEDEESIFDNVELNLASRQKSGQMIQRANGNMQFVFDSPGGQTFLSSVTHAPTVGLPSADTFLTVQIPGDEAAVGTNGTRPSTCQDSPLLVANSNAFATLGFLNSQFVFAADNGAPGLVPDLVGAPGSVGSPGWHPANLFWGNRPYVNSMELAYVPLSSPGQLGQEFSANPWQPTTASRYEPAYRSPSADQLASPIAAGGTANNQAEYSFAHLLNFFQEMPELDWPTTAGQTKHKDTPLALLFDMVDTPSPWTDVERIEAPETFESHPIFAPFRAPHNSLSRQVEPGRVNLNTINQPSVLKGLLAHAYAPIDRPNPMSDSDQAWQLFERSRRGYVGTNGQPLAPNPGLPTQFAGVFKPVSEAGMVPRTRNSLNLSDPVYSPADHSEADRHGVLDLFVRRNPVQSTLMRSVPSEDPSLTAQHLAPPTALPLFRDRNPLNSQSTHPFIEMYPIARLQKLVTERSNVFAVYTTIGLFELDSSGDFGREYGLDNGQNQRFKAFYVIDRSVPVGYRVGEDHNTENTILIRRVLSE